MKTKVITDLEELNSFFKSLSPVLNIVGNSNSLLCKKQGVLIDEFHTIRFNYGLNLNSECQGYNLNTLCINSAKVLPFWHSHNKLHFTHIISIVSSKSAALNIKEAALIKKETLNKRISYLSILPNTNFEYLKKTLGKKPSSGMSLLYFLDQINFQNINIYGFDFNVSKTFYSDKETHIKLNIPSKHKPKKAVPHNFEKEKEMILNLIEKNNWRHYE